MTSSSLSSVVSDLVRASMGSTVPKTVTDADLDRHIGEIILKEAKQKAEQYKRDGYRAYLPATDVNMPRANKRFLSSIIRSTDDHNKAVLRSQAEAAAELKEEREEQERRERRARADEAAQDRLRRLMSGGRRSIDEDRWRPRRDGGRDRERDGKRWDRNEDSAKRKPRSRSRDRKRYWDEDEDEYRSRIRPSHRRHEDDRLHRRRQHSSSRSRSPRRTRDRPKHRSRSRSPTHAKSPDAGSSRSHRPRSRSPHLDKGKSLSRSKHSYSPARRKTSDSGSSRRRHTASRSHSPRRKPESAISTKLPTPVVHTRSPTPTPAAAPMRPRSPSPPPGPPSRMPSPPPISSKMDKYFSPTYDPRLDVAPLASSSGLTIDVPATGLVDNAQFEGWDAMLELIRIRREDRAEKKRLERLGLGPEKEGKEGRGTKGKGMVSAVADDGKGIMEIEYKKKGTVREWDMGKEGF